jgi:mevalonate kinase
MEENIEAYNLYQIVQGQIITAGEHIVDINHLAVWAAIDRYDAQDKVRTFEKIIKLFQYYQDKREK